MTKENKIKLYAYSVYVNPFNLFWLMFRLFPYNKYWRKGTTHIEWIKNYNIIYGNKL